MDTPQALLAALAQGMVPRRPLFVPLFATLAAEVAGMDPSSFLQNPGRRSLVLRDLARSLPVDAIAVDSGSLWDLELAGFAIDRSTWPPRVRSGALRPLPSEVDTAARISPTLEALRRFKNLLPHGSVLALTLTGPGRYAALTGRPPEEWGRPLLAVAQLALGAGARLLLVREGPAPQDAGTWLDTVEPLLGTVRFWQGAAALALDSGAGWEAVLATLGPHLAVVVDEVSGPAPWPATARPPLWGLALRPDAEAAVPPGATLFTTAGDLYGQVPVAALGAAIRRLRARIPSPDL